MAVTSKKGVVDGDTLDVTVDQGFDSRRDERVRLFGVDTAEIYGSSRGSEEYEAGIRHRNFVLQWVAEAARDSPDEWPFTLVSRKETDKYGRHLGDLIRHSDNASLVDALIREFNI